jgi:hypothetical protein
MTNLFPLPYWAPALKRVPVPLQVLNEAYASPSTMAWRRDLEPCGRRPLFVQNEGSGRRVADAIRQVNVRLWHLARPL